MRCVINMPGRCRRSRRVTKRIDNGMHCVWHPVDATAEWHGKVDLAVPASLVHAYWQCDDMLNRTSAWLLFPGAQCLSNACACHLPSGHPQQHDGHEVPARARRHKTRVA
jgi:hypothetical protein